MATVSIEDDDVDRWVIRHSAPSIAGGEIRHRMVAVLDNQHECVDTLNLHLDELDQRRARGDDLGPGEDYTAVLVEPGDLTREPSHCEPSSAAPGTCHARRSPSLVSVCRSNGTYQSSSKTAFRTLP